MKLLKAISSLLLALLVMISSMGFYVDHMVCNMSGEHRLAINKSIEACTDTCKKTNGEAIDKPCCDYDSNYFQEDVPVNPTQKTKNQTVSAFKYVALNEVVKLVGDVEDSFRHNIDSDVLIPSVKRHILLETFLI